MSYTNNDMPESNADAYNFCDYNNERSVLALALKGEDFFYTLLSKATENDFLAPDTRSLFHILKVVHTSGARNFDVPLVAKAAEDLGYKEICDVTYLDALVHTGVSDDNYELYLNKLVDDSTKYKLYLSLLDHSEQVLANAKKLKASTSDDLLADVQSDILTLSLESSAIVEPTHVADGLDEYLESIQDKKIEIVGLTTGYPVLDSAIDGLIPGTLFVVAARKKMGKSAFLTNMASNISVKHGKPVLYIDTEMSFIEWRDRVLAIMSGVKERVIKHGGWKNDKYVYKRVMEAKAMLKDSRLYHQYLPGYTVEKISALYKKYKIKEDIELGIFDYIKEPDSTSTDRDRREHQILGDVTTKLKDLAGQLEIPFAAAVQVGRSGDVADSDRVARYGDVVAFWEMRDAKKADELGYDLKEKGHYQLRITDSRRGGRTGEWGIGYQFWRKSIAVEEVSPELQIEQGYGDDDPIDTGAFDAREHDETFEAPTS